MKVKCAFGDFANDEASNKGKPLNEIIYSNPTGSSTASSIHVLDRKCYVLGVNIFNSDSNEKDIRFYDTNPTIAAARATADSSTEYVAITTAPLVYNTIVPRDQAFSKTFSGSIVGIGTWSSTVAVDIYDTPSGIYEKFPKPGFLFENGITVNMATGMPSGPTPNSNTYFQIFYTEA